VAPALILAIAVAPELEHRTARQAALFACPLAIAQRARPRDGGIADDHAVDAALARNTDDIVEIGQRQIGRDLEQHRHEAGTCADPFARFEHAAEQVIERNCLLQVAQARRVGR
jgi:hypothetical protein